MKQKITLQRKGRSTKKKWIGSKHLFGNNDFSYFTPFFYASSNVTIFTLLKSPSLENSASPIICSMS